MFTSPLKNRLNPEAKPTVFEIPNPPPQVGCKRRIIHRTNEDVSKGTDLSFIMSIATRLKEFYFSQDAGTKLIILIIKAVFVN